VSRVLASSPLMPIAPAAGPGGDAYVPGVCNIGRWEVRRRRSFAVLAFVAAALLFTALVASGAPAWTRLLLVLPLTGGVFSWLQARRRFCAGFAMARISNFGDGEASRRSVDDEAAHRADVAAVRRMARDAVLIAGALTLAAVALPV
jgi:hypothetical protein